MSEQNPLNAKKLQALVANRYKILSVIGQGGMGAVYRAKDLKLQREVALKVIRSVCLDNRSIHERFRREVESMSKVTHPNVVRFLDFDDKADFAFFTMEYVEGEDLRSLLHQKDLSIKDIVKMMIGLAEGLAAIHRQSIIHRDIKPANIIIAEDGTAKLMDFGLVKFSQGEDSLTELTKTGVIVGTLGYLPPEILLGQKGSPKSDVYQLGLVFYKAIANRLPFENKGIVEMIKEADERVVAPLDIPGVDKELSELLVAMLAQRLEDRPSAQLVADELRQWQQRNLTAHVDHDVATIPQDVYPTSNNRIAWKFIALLAIVITAMSVFYLDIFIKQEIDLPPKFIKVELAQLTAQKTTALHEASALGTLPVLKQLLNTGAAVNGQDEFDCTPLAWATIYGHKECCQLILDKGAKVNRADHYGRTPLHLAAIHGHNEIAELLLAKGVQVDEQDNGGHCALHLAAFYGHVELIKLLVDNGADVTIKDDRDRTILMFAMETRKVEPALFLIAAGVDVKQCDDLSTNALHLAAIKGVTECIEPLVRAGAPLKARNMFGFTPQQLAQVHKNNETLQRIKEISRAQENE